MQEELEDTNGVIIIATSKKDRQHSDQRYQWGNNNPSIKEGQTTQWRNDTNGVIIIPKSKKDRQHNGQNIPLG